MSRARAADDFDTIRARIEELQRERQGQEAGPTVGVPFSGHRGPCACGLSLFPDECDGACKALSI